MDRIEQAHAELKERMAVVALRCEQRDEMKRLIKAEAEADSVLMAAYRQALQTLEPLMPATPVENTAVHG